MRSLFKVSGEKIELGRKVGNEILWPLRSLAPFPVSRNAGLSIEGRLAPGCLFHWRNLDVTCGRAVNRLGDFPSMGSAFGTRDRIEIRPTEKKGNRTE